MSRLPIRFQKSLLARHQYGNAQFLHQRFTFEEELIQFQVFCQDALFIHSCQIYRRTILRGTKVEMGFLTQEFRIKSRTGLHLGE